MRVQLTPQVRLIFTQPAYFKKIVLENYRTRSCWLPIGARIFLVSTGSAGAPTTFLCNSPEDAPGARARGTPVVSAGSVGDDWRKWLTDEVCFLPVFAVSGF